jgi:isopenicillin-N epimerase
VEVYQALQRELERQPVAFLEPARLSRRLGAVREVLAKELGTGADNLVWQVNATSALNVVAQSFDLNAGDEVLTTGHEYAALDKVWAYIGRRTGAKIVRVEVPLPLVSEEAFTEAILAGMSSRTRVLFLSHITSPTALLFPLAPSIAAARERGIFTIIDGAHTPGHIPLDLDQLGADAYAGNCHKWLMSPKGAGFLFVRPGHQRLIDPLVISHGWTLDNKENGVSGPFGNSPFVDELEVQGTRDPAAWLAVPEAIQFRNEHDWEHVAQHCAALAWETAERIAALTGLPPLSSQEFSAPQMVAIPLPDCDADAVKTRLMDEYGIEIPVYRWQDRPLVRLSVQGYNNRRDTDRLVEALVAIFAL